MAYDLVHHSGAAVSFAAGKFANGLSVTSDLIIGSYSDPGYENPVASLPFTVEGWFRLGAMTPNWCPWFQAGSNPASGGVGALAFEYAGGVTTMKAVGVYGDEVAGSLGADIRGDGIFHHCAWVITSTTTSLYFDGNRVGTGTRTGTLPGHIILPVGSFRGVLDDVRVSNSARYTTATYTLPTGPHSRDGNTVAIYRFNSDILNDTSSTTNIPPAITTLSLGTLTHGTPYSMTLSVSGTVPIGWSVVAGGLPAGLSLNSTTGEITGIPSSASSGSVSIRASNDYGTDTQLFSWTVEEAVMAGVISHTNSNIFYQPYSWRTDQASYHRALDQGSTVRIRVEGTNTIQINATGQAAYRVNQRSYVPFTNTVNVADLDSSRSSHDIEIIARDGGFQFTSLTVDTGGTSVPVRVSNLWGLAFGDSITRGAYGGAVDTAYQASYVFALGRALGAEIGIVAENSRTYESANTSGFQFADAWSIQVPGTSIPIDFTRPPDFITLMVHAFSGATGRIAQTVEAILTALPTTKVFAIRHVAIEATRLAGTNEAAPIFASIHHPRFHYIDTSGWLRDVADLPDSIHPTRDAQWLHLGPRLANAIRPLLADATGDSSSVQVWNGMSWV